MPKSLSDWLQECADLRAALDCTLSECLALTGADLGNIQLLDRRTGHLFIQAQHGFQDAFLATFESVRPGDSSACARALRRRNPVVVRDIMADPAFAPYRDVAEGAGFRAVASIPLQSQTDLLVGVVSVHFATPDEVRSLPMDRLLEVSRLAAGVILRRIRADGSFARELNVSALIQDSQQAIAVSKARIARSHRSISHSRAALNRPRR